MTETYEKTRPARAPAESKRRTLLDKLARKIACRVARIEFEPDSVQADDAFRAKLREMTP